VIADYGRYIKHLFGNLNNFSDNFVALISNIWFVINETMCSRVLGHPVDAIWPIAGRIRTLLYATIVCGGSCSLALDVVIVKNSDRFSCYEKRHKL